MNKFSFLLIELEPKNILVTNSQSLIDNNYISKNPSVYMLEDGEKTIVDTRAEDISTLMHSIYHVVSKDSQKSKESYLSLLNKLNIRKTFNPSNLQIWVMEYLGGREFISKIIFEDASLLFAFGTKTIQNFRDQ